MKDVEEVALFHQTFFGMGRIGSGEPVWLEMKSPSGGCPIALHRASKAQKSGAAVKLVFGVKDVPAFKEAAASRDPKFGPVHVVSKRLCHEFANAKDPAGISISISGRGY